MLVFRAFGTSLELDSFNAANRVSEALFNLMAGGALGSAFIPTFTGLLAKENRQRSLATGFFNCKFIDYLFGFGQFAGCNFCTPNCSLWAVYSFPPAKVSGRRN